MAESCNTNMKVVFGVSLEDSLERTQCNPKQWHHSPSYQESVPSLPDPVDATVTWLLKHISKMDGKVFGRAVKPTDRVLRYRGQFDLGRRMSFPDDESAETVTGVLLLYLSMLPTKLMHIEFDDNLSEVHFLRDVVAALTPVSKRVLHNIISMLSKIALLIQDSSEIAGTMASYIGCGKKATTLMIDHCPEVFQTKIFGMSLQDAVAISSNKKVPSPIQLCVDWLDERALSEEGLYRTCGSKLRIDWYQKSFDLGDDVVFPPHEDPSNVASLVTRYLRELPESIIPPHIAKQIVNSLTFPENERILIIRDSLTPLPDYHKETIKVLVRHLHRVAARTTLNKMTAKTLAMCILSSQAVAFEALISLSYEVFCE